MSKGEKQAQEYVVEFHICIDYNRNGDFYKMFYSGHYSEDGMEN